MTGKNAAKKFGMTMVRPLSSRVIVSYSCREEPTTEALLKASQLRRAKHNNTDVEHAGEED
jgi:hypothetical protein